MNAACYSREPARLRNLGGFGLCLAVLAGTTCESTAQTPAPSLPSPDQLTQVAGGVIPAPVVPVAKPTFDGARRMFDLDAELFEPSDPKLAAGNDAELRLTKIRSQVVDAAWSLATRDLPSALSLLHEVKQLLPKAPSPSLSAARYLLNTKEPAFREPARKLLDQAALDDRRAPEPAWEAARMALDEGRLGDALAQIDRYMQLIDVRQSPLAPDEGPNKAFRQALLLQARVYARGGRWNEVAERAEQCIAYDTEDAAAHRLRGEALYRSDPTDAANVNKAFDSFRQSYRLADKKRGASGVAVEFPPPEIQLCRLAVEFGHPEIAARYSDDLRRALPKYAQANPAERVRCGLFLAEHLLLQGDNSAGQEINAIGKLSADDLRRITAIMRYLARDPKATDDLTSLVDEFPDDERLSNYLARALADSKVLADRSRALRIATANQAAHPSSVSARCTLAWAHRYAGDPNAAFEAIRPTLQENDLAAASGTPRESPFLARLNSDDSYILAKLIYEHDPGQIGAVIALSQQSLSKIEPFRYRSLAEQWLR